MTTPTPKRRWYRFTPDRMIPATLVIEVLLWLSERFRYFGFNEHKGFTVLIAVACVGAVMLLMLVWFAASLLFRWRFQFSIQSLLVLVLVVAIPCSWMSVEMRGARKQKDAVEALEQVGWTARYDYEVRIQSNPSSGAGPLGPALLVDLLGEDFFVTVVDVGSFFVPVTDADLEHLKGLPQLQTLAVWGKNGTDAGLEHLDGLTRLRKLYLGCPNVTNAGLEHLKGMKELQYLFLDGTEVTNEGVKRLQQSLPKCHITHGF